MEKLHIEVIKQILNVTVAYIYVTAGNGTITGN